jgi:hypothetical protein
MQYDSRGIRRASAEMSKQSRIALTRWDLIVFGRAVAGTLLGLALIALITAASDEGGLSWVERAGRALPLSPFCAALGVWGALGPVKARGEALALAALGRTSRQISAAAVAGVLLVCVASCVAIAVVPSVDVASFYPIASRPPSWQWRNGGFVDPAHGLRMRVDGTLVESSIRSTEQRVAIPPRGRIAAALATALAGVAMAMLAARALLDGGGSRGRRDRMVDGLGCALAALATVVLFQVAAARLAPALLAPLPALVLAAFAARRYGADSLA